MSGSVKGKRAYVSPRRQEQAAATRRAVLESARRQFEVRGYAATTMEAIAAEADVSLKTVYVAFATKARLLRAVWDLALKGDDSDAPVAERPWYVEVLEEPDPERKLRLLARAACVVKVRIAAILRVIRDASPADAEIDGLWELIQTDFHANQRTIVAAIHETGGLRDGLDVARATDVLWTLNHPDVWLLLVGRCAWTPDEFETWLAESSCRQILGRTAPRARVRRPRP